MFNHRMKALDINTFECFMPFGDVQPRSDILHISFWDQGFLSCFNFIKYIMDRFVGINVFSRSGDENSKESVG